MKLNLGANDRAIPGFLSVDIAGPADVIADLAKPWPWEDSSVEAVKALQVFEHLPDIMHTMNELWRICRPGAIAEIEVPSASKGAGAFQDPTHRSFWTMNNFLYFAAGDPHRERFAAAYGIRAQFKVLRIVERQSKGQTYEPAWIICATLEAVK
jgi:hypothetical protein